MSATRINSARFDVSRSEVYSSGSVFGMCALHLDSMAWPAADWDDFSAMVLAEWMFVLNEILAGRLTNEWVPFMDGSYGVRIEHHAPDLQLSLITTDQQRLEGPVIMHASLLTAALYEAASTLLKQLMGSAADERQIRGLEQGIEALRVWGRQ